MFSFANSVNSVNTDISSERKNLKRYSSKLVLLGNTGVGKSSLVMQFARNFFLNNNEPTIGATFFQKSVVLDDCIINFEIWDTAGQERYHSLIPMYYRNATAAIIVYDITDDNSFTKAKMWVQELRSNSYNIVIMLVCNKIDLIGKNEIITKEGKHFAQNNDLHFIETSAKSNYNVNELFTKIAEHVPKIDKQIEPGTIVIKKEDKREYMICCYKF